MIYDKLSNAVDNLSVSLRSTAPLSRGASGEEIKFTEIPKPPLVRSNNDDRRQWRKQGVVVGAAASKTQAERSGCWVPQPGQWHGVSRDGEVISTSELFSYRLLSRVRYSEMSMGSPSAHRCSKS